MFDQLGDIILSDSSPQQLNAQVEMEKPKADDTHSESDDDDLSDNNDPDAKYFKKQNPTTRKNFPTLHDLAKEEVEKTSSTTAKAGEMAKKAAADTAEAATKGMQALSGMATEEKKTEAKQEKKNEKKQKKTEQEEKDKEKKEKDEEKEKEK